MKTLMQILEEENLLPDTDHKGVYTHKFTKHPYHDDFMEMLTSYREKFIKLIEIGADFGASTIMWDRFFLNGDITVLDTVNAKRSIDNISGRVDNNRTRIIEQDAYDINYVNSIADESIDIVIDDGPHDRESQLNCIKHYYPKLKKGGILIIEDIPNEVWITEMTSLVPNGFSRSIIYKDSKAHDSKLFICWK
jgi:demethylmacrocin O-methyltransferase